MKLFHRLDGNSFVVPQRWRQLFSVINLTIKLSPCKMAREAEATQRKINGDCFPSDSPRNSNLSTELCLSMINFPASTKRTWITPIFSRILISHKFQDWTKKFSWTTRLHCLANSFSHNVHSHLACYSLISRLEAGPLEIKEIF